MAASDTTKKRKSGSDRLIKNKQRPSKRFRRTAYNSDSDEEDNGFTARDAPAADPQPARADATTNGSSRSILKQTKTQSQPATKIPQENPPNDEPDNKSQPDSEANIASEEERDDFSVDPTADSEASDLGSDTSATSQTGSTSTRTKTKRRDPTAFATSISAILGSSLSRNKRADPVLARSKSAAEISKALSESKLEEKAKKQLVNERRLAKEKGRVKDVLIGDRKAVISDDGTHEDQISGASAAEILATEKRLRKVAQRGVIHLFNAVRAAQVRGEEEGKKVRAEGVLGMDNRDAKVNEMSRNAFLDLVGAGGERR
ncbi:MAG: hypothetical protein GOMPHAMPRED_004523 [Gomphillus americanus]|uniref:Rrp15p-domain-containing protein n=1 Tax=Gomphillus americanus TaxID=1940652 RepID=A0A8H3FNN6_9LECA|nr:MAG: hypothetical protein GOMPHAMPRED_004523 [Gomphillus americanus]